MTEQADVVVLGMGPGGEEVAGTLAEAGLDVVGVEKELVGGECPYWACVPSKMMIRAGNLIAEARRIEGMAGTAEVRPDWAPVARRIRAEATDDWDDRVAVERFVDKGGRFVRGAGRFTGPRTIAVDGREIEARRGVVIATGSVPVVPSVDGLDGTPYWTNREAVATETVPGSLLILGGGAVGTELAQAFSRFGAAVTVVETHDTLLAKEEPEAGDAVRRAFDAEGIDVVCGVRATGVRHSPDGFVLRLDDGRELSGEQLLVATGRRADLASLGLDAAGLDPGARFVDVDGRMRASDGIWAVGDLTGKGAFTHVSIYQARIAAADILGREVAPADYRALPRVTFTDPEVGAAGLTEKQAREQDIDVTTAVTDLSSSARGWIHGPGGEGLIKLVVDTCSRVLVGATAVGPHGGEMLSMFALAIHARVPVAELRRMIYAYPTFHRAIEAALDEL